MYSEMHGAGEHEGETRGPCDPAKTGGKMANLRTLSTEKVPIYHMEYYTLGDCILILTGNVQSKDFFAALGKVEALALQWKPLMKVEVQEPLRGTAVD